MHVSIVDTAKSSYEAQEWLQPITPHYMHYFSDSHLSNPDRFKISVSNRSTVNEVKLYTPRKSITLYNLNSDSCGVFSRYIKINQTLMLLKDAYGG